MTLFNNRLDAGEKLASAVEAHRCSPDTLVLGLPRGGIPVAYPIAKRFKWPLDVFIVRKLGVPGYEELAMGAIAGNGTTVLNEELIQRLKITPEVIEVVRKVEVQELARREAAYRNGCLPLDLADKPVILVDDGAATGATMKVAIHAARAMGASEITVAVPVSSQEAFEDLALLADKLVCIDTPSPFAAVGRWYREFSQTSDAEVLDFLTRARG